MSDKVTLIIDGVEVTVPKGTLIVEAAKRIDNEIPVFCYHAKMDPVGMCRMCLVEVGTPAFDRATGDPVLDDDGNQVVRFFPKPMTACTTPVSEGMVVKVNSQTAVDDRKAVLEFLLTSHPLDCPVCDKGGECPLQDLTIRHGPGNSRFDYEDKQHFPKKYPLGDLIVLDMERCIICARCTRFQSEIAHDPVLAIEERGRYAHIVSYSEPAFDSHYSGNTTDICPVGALTSRDFRFGARAWELKNISSVCNHCGVGCNTVLGTRTGDIKRIMPRQNELVNEVWICDKGRFGHHFNGSQQRLEKPLIRQNGELIEATWEDALSRVAEKFQATQSSHGSNALGGIAGARLSNEDLYLFQKFFRDVIGTNNIDHRVGLSATIADEISYTVGVGTGTNLGEVGQDSTILVIGSDLDEEAPILYLRIAGAATRQGAHLINAAGRKMKQDAQARTSVRYLYGSETQFVLGLLKATLEENLLDTDWVNSNVDGLDDLKKLLQNQSLDELANATSVSVDELKAVAKAFAESKNGIIIFGFEAGNDPVLQYAIEALSLITGHAGKANNGVIAVLPHANSRGAIDMGVLPHYQAGYVPVEGNAGLSASEMLAPDSSIKAMLIAGADPANDNESYRQQLEALDFLVVQELFLTETAKLADVILPAKAVAERDGTFTNIERRVQAFDPGVPAPNETLADWLIITAIAGEMDADWSYASSDGVMAEITHMVSIYKDMAFENLIAPISLQRKTDHYIYEGMSYTADAREGVQWHTKAESNEKITLRVELPQSSSSDGAFTLATPRILYDDGRLLAEADILEKHIRQPHVMLSRADATKLGVQNGDTLKVAKNGTTVNLPVQISRKATEGIALVPRNLSGRPAEQLTGEKNVHAAVKLEKG